MQISTDGEKHQKATDFSWLATRNIEALAPKNPQQSTQKSIKKGELLFNTYCIACHGVDGKATTPVALFRGGVVPIDAILADPTITDGYLFHKITYGGIGDIGMPPFGYSTTEKERWHLVNYITNRWRIYNKKYYCTYRDKTRKSFTDAFDGSAPEGVANGKNHRKS